VNSVCGWKSVRREESTLNFVNRCVDVTENEAGIRFLDALESRVVKIVSDFQIQQTGRGR
jgi:hypothetical protein